MIQTIELNPYLTLATWVDCEREELYDLQYRPVEQFLPQAVAPIDVAQCDEALSELYSSSARVKYALFWLFKPKANVLELTENETFALINRSTLALINDQPEVAVKAMMQFLGNEHNCAALTQVVGVPSKWTSARLWHIYFSEVASHWGVERIANAVLAQKDEGGLNGLVAQTAQLVASALHKECLKAEFVCGERVDIYYNAAMSLIGHCRAYLLLLGDFGDEAMLISSATLASRAIVKCAERYRDKCDQLGCEDKSDEMFAYARSLIANTHTEESVVSDVEQIYSVEQPQKPENRRKKIIFTLIAALISLLCILLALI